MIAADTLDDPPPVPITIMGMTSAATHPRTHPPTSMADSGANVCITSDISLLTDIVDIPPISLGVAVRSDDSTMAMCTQQGFLHIPLLDGTIHRQPFLVNPNATETILSPAHVMWSSDKISAWSQAGSKSPTALDTLTFTDASNTPLLVLPLSSHNGLQYCTHPTRGPPSNPTVRSTLHPAKPCNNTRLGLRRALDAELWAARLGFCGEWQLSTIPSHSTGTPAKFYPHPLLFV